MLSISSVRPWVSVMSLSVLWMTVRVRRPRKSILSSPMASMSSMAYCVTTSPLAPLDSGTILCRGSGEITTPAACTEAWRDRPSRRRAVSMRCSTRGSCVCNSRSRGSSAMASSSEICRRLGTSLAMRSTSLYGKSRARPTSRRTPFASIEPKVMICATFSAPYFSVT